MNIDLSKLPHNIKLEVSKEDLEAFAHTICLELKAQEVPSPKLEDEILWMDDAMRLLNLARPTIYGLLSRGKLCHYKKGRKVFFLKSELEQWLLDGKRKTQSDIDKEADDYLINKSKGSNR